MQYTHLLYILIVFHISCDDPVTPSQLIDDIDQEMMSSTEQSPDMMSDLGLITEDRGLLYSDMSNVEIIDMSRHVDPIPLDDGIEDMISIDMTVPSDFGDLVTEDQGDNMLDPDMAILDPDMTMLDPDMEIPDPGLQIRETCETSEECAEGLSCLGWPTGHFCTPTCGYMSPASGRPSNPDCPAGFALECHVSNNCLPAQCRNGCDVGYICDESNRCVPYE